jgi:hypothetical protein
MIFLCSEDYQTPQSDVNFWPHCEARKARHNEHIAIADQVVQCRTRLLCDRIKVVPDDDAKSHLAEAWCVFPGPGKSWMTRNVFGRTALTAAAETILRISCAPPEMYYRISYRFPGLFDRLHAMAPLEWSMRPHRLLGQISNMSWVISDAFFGPLGHPCSVVVCHANEYLLEVDPVSEAWAELYFLVIVLGRIYPKHCLDLPWGDCAALRMASALVVVLRQRVLIVVRRSRIALAVVVGYTQES